MSPDPTQTAPPIRDVGPVGTEAEPEAEVARLVRAQLHRVAARDDARVRARLLGDLLVVTIEQPLTRYEARIVEHGGADQVREARRGFHELMRGPLVAGVEACLGRQVVAFLHDHQLAPDVSVQTFLLEPGTAR